MDNTEIETLRDQLAAWAQGVPEERRFWSNWLETKGARWPDKFQARFDPATRLRGDIAKIVRASGKRRVRILDVGAGPVTNIGYSLPGIDLDIAAVDPLASVYAALLRQHDMTAPVTTTFATAEDLSAFFDADAFDLVLCTNALDHAMNPMRGIREMLQVTAVGAAVYLLHHENEAVAENYAGFHQHNFTLRDGRFIIWNREHEIDVAAELGDAVTIETAREPISPPSGSRASVRTLIRKHEPLPASLPASHPRRLAQWLEALVAHLVQEAGPQESR